MEEDETLSIIFTDDPPIFLSLYLSTRLPAPSECDLYYVNRDTLFSYHKDSELFLQVPTYSIFMFISNFQFHINFFEAYIF